MIIDVKILAADFMFPPTWRPVFSLSKAPKTKFQTPKSLARYRRENYHWTTLSRFATPKNFSYFHTLDTVSNVQSFCQGVSNSRKSKESPSCSSIVSPCNLDLVSLYLHPSRFKRYLFSLVSVCSGLFSNLAILSPT